jgi:hypothetical protein
MDSVLPPLESDEIVVAPRKGCMSVILTIDDYAFERFEADMGDLLKGTSRIRSTNDIEAKHGYRTNIRTIIKEITKITEFLTENDIEWKGGVPNKN